MRARRGWKDTDGCLRRGLVALWALLALAVLLAALAVAVNCAWLAEGEQELHNAADAAALAGVQGLINDDWLRDEPALIPLLLAGSRQQAQQFASQNLALTQPVALLANAGNDPNGDIVLGQIDPTSGLLVPSTNLTNPMLDQVGAMAVQARRFQARGNGVPVLLGPLVLLSSTDLQAGAVALLDRDVIGFQPLLNQPVPLVPLGVRSDPSGADPHSWENQILGRAGPDQYRYVPGTGFVADPAGDHIPEIEMELDLQPNGTAANTNAPLLQIGAGTAGVQLAIGVTAADLQPLGGQLVLGANNQLPVPGTDLGPAASTPAFTALLSGLQAVQQSQVVRVWPLVVGVDAVSGQATVTGFVGARVVKVDYQAGGPLRFTLQPGMRAVASALTDATRRGIQNLLVPNPYLAKVRLVR